MKKTLTLDEGIDINELEKRFLLKDSYANLIVFMVQNNMTELPQFEEYNRALKDNILLSQEAQKEFQKVIKREFLKENQHLTNWNLTFGNRKLIINYIEED